MAGEWQAALPSMTIDCTHPAVAVDLKQRLRRKPDRRWVRKPELPVQPALLRASRERDPRSASLRCGLAVALVIYSIH
jgi:hypothetical protein